MISHGLRVALSLCVPVLGGWGLPIAQAQDLDLVVRHTLKAAGPDGVTRTTEFSERFIRRDDQVWVERIRPGAVHAEPARQQPGQADPRKQIDVALATRWIARQGNEKPRLMLVDQLQRTIIEVDRSDYQNVGFEGSWAGAYFLVDPTLLATMSRRGARLADGGQWYELQRPGATIRVLWDEADRYPREIESVSADGMSSKLFRASKSAGRATRPWQSTANYTRIGYNDLLD